MTQVIEERKDGTLGMEFIDLPKDSWEWDLGTDGVVFTVISAPCWFHRKMQRLLVGFRWRRI